MFRKPKIQDDLQNKLTYKKPALWNSEVNKVSHFWTFYETKNCVNKN